MKKQLSKS
jgi:shikimate kinase